MSHKKYKQDPQQKRKTNGCNTQMMTRGTITMVELSKIRRVRLPACTLTEEQKAKIVKIREMFADVWPCPLAEWEEGFATDGSCSREIDLWLQIGETYTRFVREMAIRSSGAKGEVFQIILLRTMTDRAEIERHFPQVLPLRTFDRLISVLYPHHHQN
jgi:hypothetical protein